jgi:hypothetical protein
MTPLLLAWLLSFAGAALFFTAGLLCAKGRAAKDKLEIGTSVPPPVADLATLGRADVSGDVLRAILARESNDCELTGAVIADDMGLVVAATGELSDALAAYGALLAEFGAKAREALPLNEVRQVVLYCEHDATLTVRRLATMEDKFSLVTLSPAKQPVSAQTAAALGK